jgi:hypothetical protein
MRTTTDVGQRRRMGLTDNWRCRHCARTFFVGSLLADHITAHERYGLKLES